MPTEYFRSHAAYMRNVAFRHIRGIPMTATKVCINGKCHKVIPSTNPEREKIDAKQRRKVAERKRRGTKIKRVKERAAPGAKRAHHKSRGRRK